VIRWHRIKYRVAADAWFNRRGTGTIALVDCGKGPPPQIDSLVDIITEDDDGGRIETWRVRGVERGGGGTKVGLVVSKATDEEKAEAHGACGANAPAWKAGLDGMPTDRDVWAFLPIYDGEDEVELIRGRANGRWFDLADGDDRDVVRIICWIDTVERPGFSLALVKAGVAAMERLERHGHGHAVEDWLHRESLRAVVAGHPDAQAIAAAALESREVKFTRYYS
jgi:hypothetical protein